MNPDLAMGDELLKKTGAGNLFMVFGEPDIDVRDAGTASSTVEIRGLDVYDPTTGEVRSARRSTTSPPGSSTPTTTARLLRPPRLLHRRRRPLRQAPPRPQGRHRRRGLGDAQLDGLTPVPAPDDGQDRRQGHQPLRRRGHEGPERLTSPRWTRSVGPRRAARDGSSAHGQRAERVTAN